MRAARVEVSVYFCVESLAIWDWRWAVLGEERGGRSEGTDGDCWCPWTCSSSSGDVEVLCEAGLTFVISSVSVVTVVVVVGVIVGVMVSRLLRILVAGGRSLRSGIVWACTEGRYDAGLSEASDDFSV